ncbi:G-type lectin S-receptor-like serine/threonine-protein kinase At5g35370 [Magnolia sinica]|uniref:G-type lectin S-receptor-like serine/threonine-protein kinase At5g35370 n=1 Tax=Magnolia sinica TaxID=86752 RepID=UPI0026599C42|nr:G-type lectin S-receptor-like serine/threonine-protein kinase At5g35370 [Magnolia sinica]
MESILSYTTLLLLSYTLLLILHPSSAGTIFTEFISPNFTASNFRFIDSTGAFLTSRNGTFQASIYNPFLQSSYYLCVLHVASNAVIWSANRDAPISSSDSMNLTPNGISIYHTNGSLVWSTPTLRNSVTALRLSETGNLELLDRSNTSLWQSFDNPTDTIIIGQPLRAGMSLVSSVSDSSLSTGNYQFQVTDQDAVLRWFGQPYWKLSMDTRAFKDSSAAISYLQMNGTGLFLFSAGTGAVVVWQLSLQLSNFRFAKLDSKGHLIIYILSGNQPMSEFTAPTDECRLPFSCGRLGLCTDSDGQNGWSCSCPSGFRSDTKSFGCLPSDGYDLPPLACNSSSSFTYLSVGNGVHYFENNYAPPATSGNQRSSCEDLCSKNCSCLGFFYTVSSSSCYLIKDQLGSVSSMIDSEDADIMGYVKTVAGLSSSVPNSNDVNRSSGRNLPISALILLPCSGAFLLIILLVMVLWWRRWRASKTAVGKLGRPNSTSSTDFDSIPGLPVRFKYEELEAATENFKTQIGSGGFGSVYKGTLADKTLVAVKKIGNIGVQGRKEFCTEIAVIGNIHHVNLVRLRGFCAQGQQRLLVYEYMNRGSLDRSIFGVGSVLEWQERVDIALGTARGLAYLHGGCEHKIIHCDVKPENILLHDHQVKISDFGLSKLMSPEQSNLFTTMRGTRGYLAPEWLTNAAISDRTDVYSYGMVLLEIVRGRKNCSAQGQSPTADEESGNQLSSSVSESAYFPLFALEMHEQGRYLELADPRLEGRVTREEVERVVRIALCCVHEDPMLRPNMANVVAMLEGGIALSEPRVESLNFLRFYGRRFTEPTMLDGNVANGYLYRLGNSSLMSSSSGTHTSISYLSSQQVSGPR